MVVSFILVTLLHFASVVKSISYTISFSLIGKTIVLLGLSIWASLLLDRYLIRFDSLLLHTATAIIATSVCYGLLVIILGLVKQNELERIPILGIVCPAISLTLM